MAPFQSVGEELAQLQTTAVMLGLMWLDRLAEPVKTVAHGQATTQFVKVGP